MQENVLHLVFVEKNIIHNFYDMHNLIILVRYVY